jgi:hypothetical protein
VWVNLLVNCAEAISNQSLHLGEQVTHEQDTFFLKVLIQIPLEVIDRHLVAVFKFTVVVRVDLHSVVGQVNVAGLKVGNVEYFRGGAEVAIAIHVAFKYSIYTREHSKSPDIKFSLVD